jgi:hypothetical protein
LEVRFGRGRRVVLDKEVGRAVRQRRMLGRSGAVLAFSAGWLAATVQQQQQRTHIYERRQVAS